MKFWGSVRAQAGKLAFEADKMVRVRKQESVIGDAQGEINARHIGLGQLSLSLYRAGQIVHPQVANFAQEIARLEQRVAELQLELERIRTEQWVDTSEPELAASSGAPYVYSAPVMPVAPVQPVEVAPEVKCANCGAPMTLGAAFCMQCGTRVLPPQEQV
jgi:hypothetical protein